jgi:hypothetical protein
VAERRLRYSWAGYEFGEMGERRVVCPCGVSPEGSVEAVHEEGAMTKETSYRSREAMGSRSRNGGMLGNWEQFAEGCTRGSEWINRLQVLAVLSLLMICPPNRLNPNRTGFCTRVHCSMVGLSIMEICPVSVRMDGISLY